MDLQLAGKRAVVTGASKGIGRAIARQLAQEGCKVAAVARGRPGLQALADELEALGLAAPLLVACDLMQPDAPAIINDAVMRGFGGLDILVNNAGGSRPFDGLGTREQWDEAMYLNFHLARELTHVFVDGMRAQQFGRVVNITGSDEPLIVNGAAPPNGAVHIWAKALSRVVAAHGVTINCIPPGRIHSDQVDNVLLPTAEAQERWVAQNCPAGYIGDPDDLAGLATFLCSPRARYITGQVVHVDGGARRFSH